MSLNDFLKKYKKANGLANSDLARILGSNEANVGRWLRGEKIGKAWSIIIQGKIENDLGKER